VFFDYASPYAYLLAERIPAFQQRVGVEIEWVPIRLLELSNFAKGPPYSANRIKYTFADVPRCAEAYGLPILKPTKFPIDSRICLQVASLIRKEPEFPRLSHLLFRAAWVEDRDIGDVSVVASCIQASGLHAEAIVPRARSMEGERAVDALTAQAEESGVFGVPTLALGSEFFWRNDRLPILEYRLTGQIGPAA